MIEEPPDGLPAVLMAEKSVISSFMRQPGRFIGRSAAEGIDAECFHLRRPLYDAVIEFHKANPDAVEIDPVGFITGLQLSGQLDRCGGPAEVMDSWSYTHELFDGWTLWTEQLREAKARRMGILAARRLSEATTSEEAIEELKTSLQALQGAITGKSRAKSGKDCVAEFIAEWKAQYESTESTPGMATGFDEIDSISGGMRNGSLWIICAKSTRGKSVMLLQIAAHAMSNGKTVAIFTLEMTRMEVVGRLVTVMANMDYGPITQPKTSNKHDRAAMARGISDVIAAKSWIDDTPNQSMIHIEDECQRIKDSTGALDLIVIDYMQIVKGEKQRGETREQEVARISMAGKQLAKKFGCPVLSASQLNGMGEVRESKSLEQDADTLLFIADDGIKIGKMRNGKRDDVIRLFLHGDKQKFLNYLP